jgi:crotonobetaine/carnitine-CoA ligase
LLGVREDDVLLTTLPLFHTNALNTFYQALLTVRRWWWNRASRPPGFAASLSGHGCDGDLCARRDGADPAVAAGR